MEIPPYNIEDISTVRCYFDEFLKNKLCEFNPRLRARLRKSGLLEVHHTSGFSNMWCITPKTETIIKFLQENENMDLAKVYGMNALLTEKQRKVVMDIYAYSKKNSCYDFRVGELAELIGLKNAFAITKHILKINEIYPDLFGLYLTTESGYRERHIALNQHEPPPDFLNTFPEIPEPSPETPSYKTIENKRERLLAYRREYQRKYYHLHHDEQREYHRNWNRLHYGVNAK